MRSSTSALIFDLDGLILDSERVSREIWNVTAKEFGVELDEIYPRLIGRGLAGVDAMLAEHLGDPGLVVRMRARKNEIQSGHLAQQAIPLKPGALETLMRARTHGYKTALATGSTRGANIALLRRFISSVAPGPISLRARRISGGIGDMTFPHQGAQDQPTRSPLK
jgi:beta-phosphoglucomutase-like phosphatase (HAD superfamily)